jgi:peptidyl-tRNA hydrolase, PTH1 family
MIIVGLGNPGAEFEATYHNVGKLALEAFVRLANEKAAAVGEFKTHKKLFAFAVAKDAAAGYAAFVVPLVFMNESGAAVREAMKKCKAQPAALVVIHDDSDLPIGSYRISVGSGAAGHKGVQSVIDALHTADFTRIRIGIRPAREKTRKKASAFVLKKITQKDCAVLNTVFQKIAEELF